MFSHRAYLGDCTHLGSLLTYGSLQLKEDLVYRQESAYNCVKTLGAQSGSAHQSIQQSKYLDLKYLEVIKSMFSLLGFLHQELGVSGSLDEDKFGSIDQTVDDVFNKSKWIVGGILEKWKTIQDQQSQIGKTKQVIIFKGLQQNESLMKAEKEVKDLSETVGILRAQVVYFQNTQGTMLNDNNNLTMQLTKAQMEHQRLTVQLQKGIVELVRVKQESEGKLIQLSEFEDHMQSLHQKQSTIEQLKMENASFSQCQFQQKQKLLRLQQLISLQKEQSHQICNQYQRDLQQTIVAKREIEFNLHLRIQDKDSEILALQKEMQLAYQELEDIRLRNIDCQTELQAFVSSPRSNCSRIQEQQDQIQQQKLRSEQQVNRLKNLFSNLENKHLEMITKPKRWEHIPNTVCQSVQGKTTQDVEATSIQSQTEAGPSQDEMHSLLKEYEMKSEARLNELCKTNQLLRKQNQKLSYSREDLYNKVSLLQQSNESLRREIETRIKVAALSKITQQPTLTNSQLIQMDRNEIIRSIGSKIQTLQDFMKSLADQKQGLEVKQKPSIEYNCHPVECYSNKLEHLFEIQGINSQNVPHIRYSMSQEMQPVRKASETRKINTPLTIVRTGSYPITHNSGLQQTSTLVQHQSLIQQRLHTPESQTVYHRTVSQNSAISNQQQRIINPVPTTQRLSPTSKIQIKPKTHIQRNPVQIPLIKMAMTHSYAVPK